MLYAVRVRGKGRVEVPAYGIADAEHLVEKELGGLWPGGRVTITEVKRTDAKKGIVEEFTILYRLDGELKVDVENADAAASAAFRRARELVGARRYVRTSWEAIGKPIPA